MPQRPDGKSGKRDRVVFNSDGAERIVKVVRIVEAGNRDAAPLRFDRIGGGSRNQAFRICTFTGGWGIDVSKTVIFKNQTTTPNTVSAVNLFWPVPDVSGPRDCAIGKDGTAWYLIVPRLYSVDAATAATLSATSLRFDTVPVVAFSTTTAGSFSVSVAECTTAG